MDTRMKGKDGYMALKLDISKAYDRVEWSFLEAIMKQIGFENRWISSIMTCVRTVKYSILVNGQPYGSINPIRGLRHGDPLSPYLFLLFVEGLCTTLNRVEREQEITGLPVTRGGTRLNHLFFADDDHLFCKANVPEWIRMQQVLELYEKASGQKLNKEKTSLFFNRNTKAKTRRHISWVAAVNPTQRYEKYLGLPAMVGRSRIKPFEGVKGRILDKMYGWKEKFLSQAGKEVLLKAVV
jgi:hypothetical protein